MSRHLWWRGAAALAVGVSVLAGAPAAYAATPTVAVAMGDSYISGEAGRWQGNSDVTTTNSGGTDRAWSGTSADPARVYGATYASGCHRSDVSELAGATLGVDRLVNLACSGATTANVLPAARGGVSFKGELPQTDQLRTIATTSTVKLIVLSVGGNDLGFGQIIANCIEDWFWSSYCSDTEQGNVDAALPAMRSGVAASILGIRDTMRAAGYADGSYRLVLQSYPSPLPRGANLRYPDSGWTRWNEGCPVVTADATWVRDRLVPQLSDELKTLASTGGAEFLDLRDSFDGREVCAKNLVRADKTHPPTERTSEWIREFWGTTSEGRQQETFHPDAIGQKALSRCLTLVSGKTPGSYRCLNTAGAGTEGMKLV